MNNQKYDLSGFESQEELQVVKSDALKFKSDEEFRFMATSRKLEEIATTSGDLKAALADARLEAGNQTTYVAQLQDPEKKAAATFELKQLNFTVDKVLEKIRLKGPAVVLQLKRDLKQIQFNIDDTTELLADIEVLMPTLPVSI